MSNDGAASASMQMQGGIFNQMVMQEAMKDKEIQIKKEMQREEDEANQQFEQAEEDKDDELDSDDDFNSDGDDQIKSLRDQRIAAMKEKFA